MSLSWKAKRNHLWKLIKHVSERNGGDDQEWLRDYAKEVIKKYADNLDVAIACFEDLIRKEAKKCVVESQKDICVPLLDSMERN